LCLLRGGEKKQAEQTDEIPCHWIWFLINIVRRASSSYGIGNPKQCLKYAYSLFYVQLCYVRTSGVSPSLVSRYIVKATVFGVLEDLTFKISEGSDQNWSCPESALLAVSVHNTLKSKKILNHLTYIIRYSGPLQDFEKIEDAFCSFKMPHYFLPLSTAYND
jgi:hypothetical protein